MHAIMRTQLRQPDRSHTHARTHFHPPTHLRALIHTNARMQCRFNGLIEWMVHGLLTDTRHEFIIDAPARPEPPADASANANGELRSAKTDGPAAAQSLCA